MSAHQPGDFNVLVPKMSQWKTTIKDGEQASMSVSMQRCKLIPPSGALMRAFSDRMSLKTASKQQQQHYHRGRQTLPEAG